MLTHWHLLGNIDQFGDPASRADERPPGFVGPFCKRVVSQFGVFALSFAFAKHPRMLGFRHAFGSEFALAMTANPAAAVIVEIVEFDHLGNGRTGLTVRPLAV